LGAASAPNDKSPLRRPDIAVPAGFIILSVVGIGPPHHGVGRFGSHMHGATAKKTGSFHVCAALLISARQKTSDGINPCLTFPPHNGGVVNRFRGHMQQARQKGFTLIELSIVLVIIGLIYNGSKLAQINQ